MKKWLLLLNHAYLFFGTTLHVGALWALRFFWYESWGLFKLEDVQVHFVGPTSRATAFFMWVVPMMLVSNLVLIISERRSRAIWLSVSTAACLGLATYVGQVYIMPLNALIAAGLPSQHQLTARLDDWMTYNSIRLWLVTAMWLLLLAYFVKRGRLLDALSEPIGRPARDPIPV